jgi:L-malate glycosyltransferase
MIHNRKVVITLPVLFNAGTEVQTLQLCKALVKLYFEVTVICFYQYDPYMLTEYKKERVEVLLLQLENRNKLYLFKHLYKKIGNLKPDIVHVQYMAPGFIPVLAAKLAGVKIIFSTIHYPYHYHGLKAKILVRLAAMLSTSFTCVSNSVKESWFGGKCLKAKKYKIIFNSIETKTPFSFDKRGSRRTGHKVISVVGRFSKEKGQDYAVEVLSILLSKYKQNVILKLVGEGGFKKEIERAALKFKVEKNISWEGVLVEENLIQAYQETDVLLVPSRFEGFGLVAAEAMLYQTPVVAFDSGGIVEVVENNKTGFVVEAGNTDEMAKAVFWLLNDQKLYQNFAFRSRERIRKHFSFDRYLTEVSLLYDI